MLICITGVAGSGKSTVLGMLKKLKYNTFAMDDYVHQIYQRDDLGYKLIIDHFGKQYVNEQEVDRKALGKLVFNDKKQLAKLNSIMIPVMQNKLVELISLKQTYFVELAVYLNHEKSFKKYFKKIILILVPKKLEKNNLKQKFNHLKKFPTKNVGNLKNPIEINAIKHDYLLENNSDKKTLLKNILKIVKKF
ncbi:MAG: dephospho-CoA kinase [Mycoplasmataceae bacterium]|nr:dephospho-CoA kinase [Mycoplasmataceae bacterium]